MNTGIRYNSNYENSPNSGSSTASDLTDAVVDTMVRWPMRVTGATVDFMLQGMRQMTGVSGSGNSSVSSSNHPNGSSMSYESSSTPSGPRASSGTGSNWTSMFSGSSSGTFDQDLSGDDLKYVIYSIVFTKPGYECILEKQREELVNYAADSNTYAAVKIAKFLDSARYGHSERPEEWEERNYPSDAGKSRGAARKESTTIVSTPNSMTVSSSATGAAGAENRTAGATAERDRQDKHEKGEKNDKGWRIPPEDQKFICFLYKVDRRLPKQEEVTRVERVTVERNTRVV